MSDFRQALGHAFHDPALLAEALTHRSHGHRHNERLEFLGDAILNHAIAEALYLALPRAREGELTRIRAELVREGTLAALARELELGDALHLGAGELKSGGYRRDSILADALEAVIGAVYLDAGWDACRALVQRWFAGRLEQFREGRVEKDAKTRLQEWLQGRGHALPEYELLGSSGSEHEKTFQARCGVPALGLYGEGTGNSRRSAETAAAAALLQKIEATEPDEAALAHGHGRRA
jgi:ribonuclease-3